MKKILKFVLVVVCALSCIVAFSSCMSTSTCAAHTDINSDGMCDTCGGAYTCPGHADANTDGSCDFCLAEFTCPGHTDADANGKCDNCGADVEVQQPTDPTEPTNPDNGAEELSFAQKLARFIRSIIDAIKNFFIGLIGKLG